MRWWDGGCERQGASLKASFSLEAGIWASFLHLWLPPDAFAISSVEEQCQEVGGPKIS